MVAVTPVRLGEPSGRFLRMEIWWGEAPERPETSRRANVRGFRFREVTPKTAPSRCPALIPARRAFWPNEWCG